MYENQRNCLVIAHRGASAYAPENTMPAFQLALEQGADGIELDVQLTRDGEIVVMHDERVDRTTSLKGAVKDLAWTDLKEADAGSWFHPRFAGTRVARLAEVIGTFPQFVFNIELKNSIFEYPGLEEKVIDLIGRYNLFDQVILSSFNHESMLRVKHLEPRIRTGLLYDAVLAHPVQYARSAMADYMHPSFWSLKTRAVSELAAHGIGINTWTVNEQSHMLQVLQANVAGIITNYPDRLRAILKSQS